MTIALSPMRNLILVNLRPLPEKTGSIVRVSRYEPARWADVIAVGPECRDVRQGMVVLVPPLVGQLVQDNQLLPESSVLAYEETP